MRARYTLPALMLLLFVVQQIQADAIFKKCRNRTGISLCELPAYLPYDIRQGLDLQWIALLPVGGAVAQLAEAGRFPNSIATRYFVSSLAVMGFWYFVGLWFERLTAGRRLRAEQTVANRRLRKAVLIMIPLIPLASYHITHAGIEGSSATWAVALPVLALTVMAAVECKLAPPILRVLRSKYLPLMAAAALTILYVWASDQALRPLSSERIPLEQSPLGFRSFGGTPGALDVMALALPAWGFTAVLERTQSEKAVADLEVWLSVMVFLYWYLLLTFSSQRRLTASSIFRPIAGALSLIFAILLIVLLGGWLAGSGARGEGFLGAILGLIALRYALKPNPPVGPVLFTRASQTSV